MLGRAKGNSDKDVVQWTASFFVVKANFDEV